MEFALYDTALMVRWLKELGQLNEEEIQRSETMLTACSDGVLKYIPERGSMNRAALAGLGAATIARLFPDAPRASAWREFSEATWGDWWPYRDTFEDSSNYNALWLAGVLLQAEQLGKADDLKCAGVEALIDRYYQLVSPVGVIPDYGDATWCSAWDLWVAVFERGASLFGRADFKRAADSIFRYAQGQPRACGPALVHAWLWARDDLKPGERPRKSLSTTRRDAYGRTLFDKLILRAAESDAYVLVNLHDSGYHGHNDGCALCAFIVGDSVLLHETGYHQHSDEDQNTFLARAPYQLVGTGRGPKEEFLYAKQRLLAGQWYTWEVDLRRPGTYTGGPMPDLKKMTNAFFRIEYKDPTEARFDFDIERIEGVDSKGKTTVLAKDFHEVVQFQAGQGGAKFIGPSFSPPVDLTPYERLRVRWRTADARPQIYFGFNGEGGTLRFWFPQRFTESVNVDELDGVIYSKVVERMADSVGRPLEHTRELGLVKQNGALCVLDTVRFEEAGEYAVGPVWHVQNVLASNESGFLCRDDWQWDMDRGKGAPAPWASKPRPVWIGLAGPQGTSLGRVEKTFTEWDYTVPQKNHLFARWVGRREAREQVGLLSVLIPMPRTNSLVRGMPGDSAAPPSDVKVSLSAQGAVVETGGCRCLLGDARRGSHLAPNP
jgi:hypothetical protein